MIARTEPKLLMVADMGRGCPSIIHRPPTAPPPFRLLDLPAELQNRIVNYFIVSESPITIHEPRFNRHPPSHPRPLSRPRYDRPVPPTPPLSRSPSQGHEGLGHTRLALMLTCRRLYREHWKTYYGDNIFDFNLDVFRRFSKEIPARCRSQIRRVEFRMPHRQHHEQVWRMLGSMRGLEELELRMKKPIVTDETVEDCCIRGIARCGKLGSIRLRRDRGTDDEDPDQELLARDRALEDRVNVMLKTRTGSKRLRGRDERTNER